MTPRGTEAAEVMRSWKMSGRGSQESRRGVRSYEESTANKQNSKQTQDSREELANGLIAIATGPQGKQRRKGKSQPVCLCVPWPSLGRATAHRASHTFLPPRAGIGGPGKKNSAALMVRQ